MKENVVSSSEVRDFDSLLYLSEADSYRHFAMLLILHRPVFSTLGQGASSIVPHGEYRVLFGGMSTSKTADSL